MNLEQVRSLQETFSTLVFRRVQTVYPHMLQETRYYSLPAKYEVLSSSKIHDPASLEWKKNIEQRFASYYGFTSSASLRANDPASGQPFFFHRLQRGDLSVHSFTIVPTTADYASVPPRAGDLICGVVEPLNALRQKNRKPAFERWFTCSEQFYRAWTLVMYVDHDSFHKAEKKACGTRQYWMSGNRLMTHNFLKWQLAGKEHGISPSPEEKHERYWHLRTESPSRTWIHVYCALVLIVRYGELPSANNVPMVRSGEATYSEWHLPPDFESNLSSWGNKLEGHKKNSRTL